MNKYDKIDYAEMEILEWCLANAPKEKMNRDYFEGIRVKLHKEINNELYERDERHWADK